MYTRPNQTHTHVSGLNVLFDVHRYAQVAASNVRGGEKNTVVKMLFFTKCTYTHFHTHATWEASPLTSEEVPLP